MGRRREENRKTAVARRQPAAAAAATRRGLLYAPEGLVALAVPDAAAGPEASGTLSNSVDFKPLPLSNVRSHRAHMIQRQRLPIAFSQIGAPSHLGMLCARSCTLVCQMHMSGVFDLIHGDVGFVS